MSDGQVIYEIRGDNSKFQSDVNQTEKIAQSKSSKIGGFAKAAIAGIGTAVVAVGAGMLAFGKESIEAGSSFDKSMSQVAATMGVSVDEIQDLTNYAMEMGATTAFSANEAAQALNYMALAGYDADTSMKMLPNVLNLAAAGNISLARASDMVTDAQSALGLSLDETNVLVDKMAKTSSKSNTSVEQLGDAILTVGGTAKMLKGGTTELNTVLGLLADNGIKGAEGGTALRNILLALGTPTDQAKKKLDELGVSAYDADGNMRGLEDIFGDLNVAMADMSEGEKAEVLNTIFNKVDLKSANALLATSAERWEELSGAIDDASGSAQQMAETQLDNLAGDVTLFKSAMEGAKITLSHALTPALRDFVQFGTKEITKLDKAFQSGGIEGLATQMGKSLGDATKKILEYVPTFASAAVKLAFSLIDSIGSTLTKNASNIIRSGINLIKDFASNLIKRIPSLMGGIGDIIGEVIVNIPNIVKLGVDIVKGLAEGIIEGIPKFLSGVGDGIIGLFSGPVSEDVSIAKDRLGDLQDKFHDVDSDLEGMRTSLSKIDSKYGEAQHWLDVFDDLSSKTSLTKDEQYKLNYAVDKLNDIMPNLGLTIDTETGKWNLNTEAILDNIEAMKHREMADVYTDKAREFMDKIADMNIELEKEKAHLLELRDRQEELTKTIDAAQVPYDNFYNELVAQREALGKLEFGWDEGTDAMRDYAKSLGITEDSFVSWGGVLQTGSDQLKDWKNDLADVDTQIMISESTIGSLGLGIAGLQAQVDAFYTYADRELSEAAKHTEKIGADMGLGLVKGLDGKLAAVEQSAGRLSTAALNKMKAVALIKSPSKRARKEVGEQIGEGEVLGLEDKIPDVEKASEKLINAIDLSVPSASISTGSGSDDRISAIIAVLNKYLPRIGAPIVLDTGELVGATVDQYDYELGVMQQRRARYE